MQKLNQWCCVFIILSVPIVGLDLATVHAETPDISSLDWTLDATITLSVKKAGKDTLKGTATLYVGPNVDQGLSEGQWKLIDPEGDVLQGNYHEKADKPGKGIFHFEPTNLSAYLLIKLEKFAAGSDVSDIAIGVPQGNMYPKVKATKKGLTFTLNTRVKADVSATVEGQPETTSATFTMKLKGTRASTPTTQETDGSQWLIALDEKVTMKGMKKYTEQNEIMIILGPNAAAELAANEFMIIGDLEESDPPTMLGTYTQKKNKITFYGLEDEFVDNIIGMVERTFDIQDDIQYYSNIEVHDMTIRASATVKPGESIKLNVVTKFKGSAYVNGEYGEGKGTLTTKGDGIPAP
jgi:hypothetical protein